LQVNTVKEISTLRYYTGAHPEIRQLLRSGRRPSEFGDKVWATSIILIQFLEKKPFPLQGLRVLEIGCGWGLLGVYLAKVYGCKVTCTDLDERVLPIVQLHAKLNSVSVSTQQAAFSDLNQEYIKDFDVILGAEVCYSEEVGKELLQLVERASAAGVRRILIADPGRPSFNDLYESCTRMPNTQMLELPGSVNGKQTKLLVCQSNVADKPNR
jgi:predicted nicotinamide N-methyase